MVERVIAGKYVLEQELGRGGFGTVFRALHRDLQKSVALKVMNPELAHDEAAQKRFLREVEATTSFVHKFAVQLRDFGRDPQLGVLYYTMDLVDGPTVRKVLREAGTLDERRAVTIVSQALEALEEAHAAGLVHRDLKPENLILTRGARGEEVRVLDFGIAKAVSSSRDGTDALTIAGQTVGTLSYMSPEQADGQKLDGRSDLYSMGVVLYELLSGRRPIEPDPGAEDSVRQMLTRLIVRPPVALTQVAPRVTPALAAVVMRCLAKDPAERPQTARAMREALQAALPSDMDRAPTPLPDDDGSLATLPPTPAEALRAQGVDEAGGTPTIGGISVDAIRADQELTIKTPGPMPKQVADGARGDPAYLRTIAEPQRAAPRVDPAAPYLNTVAEPAREVGYLPTMAGPAGGRGEEPTVPPRPPKGKLVAAHEEAPPPPPPVAPPRRSVVPLLIALLLVPLLGVGALVAANVGGLRTTLGQRLALLGDGPRTATHTEVVTTTTPTTTTPTTTTPTTPTTTTPTTTTPTTTTPTTTTPTTTTPTTTTPTTTTTTPTTTTPTTTTPTTTTPTTTEATRPTTTEVTRPTTEAAPRREGVVVLKNGNVIIGRFTNETAQALTVVSGGGTIQLPKHTIRWFQAGVTEPTDEYWSRFADEPIADEWLGARERWRAAHRAPEQPTASFRLALAQPLDGAVVNGELTVTGAVLDVDGPVEVTVGGARVPVQDGAFETTVLLPAGAHQVQVVARAGGGAVTEVRRVMSVATPKGGVGGGADVLEPNDSAEGAADLPLGYTRRAVLEGEDFYAVNLPRLHELRAAVGFEHDDGDVDLELLDPQGRVVASSRGTSDAEGLRWATREAGRYVLRVYNGANIYSLLTSVEPYVPVDRFEPNDGVVQAAELQEGTFDGLVCTGEDWYLLHSRPGRELDVTLDFSNAAGDLDIRLYDSSMTELASSVGTTDQERLQAIVPDDGIVYIDVYHAQGRYSLKLESRDPPADDALEPNDGPTQARRMKPGRTEGLITDPADWYVVTLSPGQTVRVTATHDPARPLSLCMLAPDGQLELRYGTTLTPGTDVVEVTTRRGFDVFVRVRASGFVRYAMQVEVGTITPVDALEPNDYAFDPVLIQPGQLDRLVCEGEDYYAVQLRGGARLQVVLDFLHANGDIDVALLDPSGGVVASSTGTTDREVINEVVQEAGMYLVRVYTAYQASPYRMGIAVLKR